MQREFLEQLLNFLTDEVQRKDVIQKIMDKHGEGIETLKVNNTDLTTQLKNKDSELGEANKLIKSLQESNKGNEELQGQINTYNEQITKLQAENEQLKIDNAIKVGLLAEKAKADDLDYLMFKIKQDNTNLKLDENGNVKGLDYKDIKVAYPNNFEVSSKKEVDVNNLPQIKEPDVSVSKEEFDKMGYSAKVKLKAENPEVYNTLVNKSN